MQSRVSLFALFAFIHIYFDPFFNFLVNISTKRVKLTAALILKQFLQFLANFATGFEKNPWQHANCARRINYVWEIISKLLKMYEFLLAAIMNAKGHLSLSSRALKTVTALPSPFPTAASRGHSCFAYRETKVASAPLSNLAKPLSRLVQFLSPRHKGHSSSFTFLSEPRER